MADNVPITAGAGTSIAADDISSVFYQRVKFSLGADGVAVDAVAGAGAVSTGVQRMTLASDDPAVVAIGAVALETTLGNVVTNTADLLASFTAAVDDLPRPKVALIAETPFLKAAYNYVAVSTVQMLTDTAASQKSAIYEMHLMVSGHAADCLITFKSGATVLGYVNAKSGVNTGIDMDFRSYPHLWSAAAADDLTITPSVACDITGWADYKTGLTT